MIAIIVSIVISLSILLSAFVSFSPNFKSLVEGDIRRKVEESAWSYAMKSGQLITRAGFLAGPGAGDNTPGDLVCDRVGHDLICRENLGFRFERNAAGGWTNIGHICVRVRHNIVPNQRGQIFVDRVTHSRDACPP